ncbi:hypothetical protein K2E95_17210 [Pseudomonas sp. ERGC3:01]|nr:hypothetical protein [Pseudomonas sp. ERGC3:01]
MYPKLIFKRQVTVALVFCLLSGCEYNGSDQSDTTEFSALPIIERAVASLVPTFAGQNNDSIMNAVCALARGQQSPEQVYGTMKAQGIDLSSVPLQGHPLSLLVNKDSAERVSSCAAYVATSVMKIPSLHEITIDYKEGMSADEAVEKIDPIKMDNFLGRRLAIAKSNSDVYALIGRELKKAREKLLCNMTSKLSNYSRSLLRCICNELKL